MSTAIVEPDSDVSKFAEKDHSMAQRAAWLVKNGKPSPEADRLDDVFGILLQAIDDENKKHFAQVKSLLSAEKLEFSPANIDSYMDKVSCSERHLLARFGFARWQDAQVSDQRDARQMLGKPIDPIAEGNELALDAVKTSRRALAADVEAAVHENAAIDPLRRAASALREALNHLTKASESRADNRRRIEEATGVKQNVPSHDPLIALVLVERALERHTGSLRGLQCHERNAQLNIQLIELHDAGVTLEHIAFILGYSPENCRAHSNGWNVVRTRLHRAKSKDPNVVTSE